MASQPLVHVFLVSFPGQGHVNPLLRLGKLLASNGLLVTFSAPEHIGRQITKATNTVPGQPTPVGDGFLRFEFFEDGWAEEDDPKRLDLDLYLPQLELAGKKALTEILNRHEREGRPVTCLINNPFIPWVSDLAETLSIPSAMLWVQSCASFSAYYHYHNSLVPFPSEDEPEIDVQLPNMPLLKHDEIPSFLCPNTPFPFLRRAILSQYKNLSKPFCIVMDTFQELEQDVIDYMSKLLPIRPVGPLFKNPKTQNSSSSTISGDFLKAENDCIEWLNTKESSSVVYISFGSIVYVEQEQITEIAHGLLGSGLSFLWVLKQPHKDFGFVPLVLPDGFLERVEGRGKVVQWCPQEQVLAHPALSCFVTHCGWNSTMEALTNGVPVVAFPRWGDQVTNAKYLVDAFKVGVRMSRGQEENKVILRDKVEKCLREATVAVELKENAAKWKKKAEEAVAEGGSSNENIKYFVEQIRMGKGMETSVGTPTCS